MNDTTAPRGTPDETAGGTPPASEGATTPGYQPPPGQAYPPKPSGMDGFFDSIRRTGLVRSEERWIGGVSGGLARRLAIDPLIVRGLFGVSVLLGGLGLVLYGFAWLLLPEERDGRIHFQQLIRGDFDAAVIGGFALLLIGFAFPNRWAPFLWWTGDSGWWRGLIGLAAVAVIIAVIASTASKNRTTAPPSGAPYTPAPGTPSAPGATYSPAPGATYSAPTSAAAPRRPEGPTMYPAPPAPRQPYAPAGPRPPYGPTPPPAPVKKGPGGTAVGIVFAVSLLVLAALLYAERVGSFDGPVLLTAGSVAVILAGLGIAVAGIRGRTSGGLGALAIVSVIVMLPLAAVDGVTWNLNSVAVGDVQHTPTTVEEAEDGFSLGAGESTIDLTELPLDGEEFTVPIHLGTGELTVIVPEDGAYTARIRVMAGEIRWLDEARNSRVGSSWEEYETEAVREGADPDVALRITVGAGQVTVVEESR